MQGGLSVKILVTGGAGFIGSHVVDVYLAEGHEVVVIDNLLSGREENINSEAKFYKVDIRSSEVEKIFSLEKPDILNHHAAQIDVRKSVSDPINDASINVEGTINLLKAAIKHNVQKVIFASSGGVVYGEPKYLPTDEKHQLGPLSPYGVSKLTGEYYLKCFQEIYGLRWTALRYANVYGPRQDPFGEAGVIAIFCQAMLSGGEVKIYGTGEQLRDYVYVGDAVLANTLALEHADNWAVNIGTAIGTSVNSLFDQLALITGYNLKPKYCPPRSGELQAIYLKNDLAKKVLKWEPQIDLNKGLNLTVEYFRRKALKPVMGEDIGISG
jgi:UDP-glucose 4-epimerase